MQCGMGKFLFVGFCLVGVFELMLDIKQLDVGGCGYQCDWDLYCQEWFQFDQLDYYGNWYDDCKVGGQC